MNRYRLSDNALQDVFDILDYVAPDNPKAAEDIRDILFGAFARLARRPGMGHLRRDLTDRPLKFWTASRRYTVVYRSYNGGVEIVRVFGPGRDIASLLR